MKLLSVVQECQDLAKLKRNDLMMVRLMCNVTSKDRKSSHKMRYHISVGKHKKLYTTMDNESWLKKCRKNVEEIG